MSYNEDKYKFYITDLRKNYIKPSHPIAFSNPTSIYQHYKKKLPLKVIKEELSKFDSYTLHRQIKRAQKNPWVIHHIRQQFQIDLVDLHDLKHYNKNHPMY